MLDIHALNMLFWAIVIVSAAAIGAAAIAIITAWLVDRRRHARQVVTGIRDAEAHLAEAARDHIAR